MARPDTYEDTMRLHDVAFYEWLGGLTVDYGNLGGSPRVAFPILRIYSSPHRAYADIVDLLVKLNFVDGASAEEMRQRAEEDFAVLPLPIATIERDEPTPDPELPGAPTKEIRSMEWDETNQKWIRHRHPLHHRTEYRVTFWMHYKYTDAFIREWLYGQIAERGKAENEFFIPVQHRDPWGTMMHAVKWTGSSDQSELEGENPRYIRKEFTFSVRTWIMKPSLEGDYLVEKTGADAYQIAGDDGVVLDEAEMDVQSDNLFKIMIPMNKFETLWPVEGDAHVESSVEFPPTVMNQIPFTFRMWVADQADKVHLIESPSRLDPDGYDVFGISFEYLATGRVELEVMQRDFVLDELKSADSLILPETALWEKIHLFTLVDEGSYLAQIAGIQNQPEQEVHLSMLDVRRVYPQTKIAPTDSVDLGAEIKYRWFALAARPYLCIIAITSTTGGLNVVTVEDDAAAPAYTAQRVVDSSVQVGLVFLVQPKSDSLALRVPKTTAVAAVYTQQFDGPYNGHTV